MVKKGTKQEKNRLIQDILKKRMKIKRLRNKQQKYHRDCVRLNMNLFIIGSETIGHGFHFSSVSCQYSNLCVVQ